MLGPHGHERRGVEPGRAPLEARVVPGRPLLQAIRLAPAQAHELQILDLGGFGLRDAEAEKL